MVEQEKNKNTQNRNYSRKIKFGRIEKHQITLLSYKEVATF